MNGSWALRPRVGWPLFRVAIGLAQAGSYEAPLPERLSGEPDLCAHVPCKDVIDGDSFSQRKGKPTYVEVYKTRMHEQRRKDAAQADKELVGYVFLSTDIVDEHDSFTFRDTDYLNLYSIEAAGAPAYRESGIFIVRDGNFSPAYPWSLVFLANKVDRETGAKTFINFDREYWLPDRYLEGGRPAFDRGQVHNGPH